MPKPTKPPSGGFNFFLTKVLKYIGGFQYLIQGLMLPEITTVVQIGGAWVGLSLVGALGSTMADKVGSILIQRWEKNIEAEARKMPPIVITQPTAPHVLDLNSPCPSE